MNTRTKIVCTIGPSVRDAQKIEQLIEEGMNVARINFSHGVKKEHEEVINLLKEIRKKKGVPLAIMLDTKGPEVRLGMIRGGSLELKAKQKWLLIKEAVEGDTEKVTVTPDYALDALKPGMKVLFDDGYIEAIVLEKTPQGVMVQMENNGIIRSQKGINVPGVDLKLPSLTERDIEDIRLGCLLEVDYIAVSFVRVAEDVLHIKNLLEEENCPSIKILAKIETQQAVENFGAILQISDGIMIARGDLGVEVPLSEVPTLQKKMIKESAIAGKLTVTATQMLESMIYNPRPTRAEVSDVANAIYDGTSAVMLSGETAAGKFPIEAVKVMKSVIVETEKHLEYKGFFAHHTELTFHDVPLATTLATVKTAYSLGARAIFAFTSSGRSASLLSRLRPEMPIVTMTFKEGIYHQMALEWGVVPFLEQPLKNLEEALEILSSLALKNNLVSLGDLIVLTAGNRSFGVSGTTNTMMVESIGDVLVRGAKGIGKRVHGNVALVLSSELKKPFQVREKILVLPRCDASFLPLIQESLGVILQNQSDDVESEKLALLYSKEYNVPFLMGGGSALAILKEGQLVTLDPEKALVYKGVISF